MARKKKNTEEPDSLEIETEDVAEDTVELEEIKEEAAEPTIIPEVAEAPPEVIKAPVEVDVKKSPYPSIDETFNNYLTNLKALNHAVAIKYLSSLFFNLAMKGDEKQLDYTLTLMKEHKKYVLNFYKALGSIQTINKSTKSKVELMFVIFNKIINNTNNQISYDVVRKETGNEKLIMWMNRRIKK